MSIQSCKTVETELQMPAKETAPQRFYGQLDINESDTFKLIMSTGIVCLIQRETNRKASNLKKPTTFTTYEIYAFIGIIFFAGAIKSNNENYKDLDNVVNLNGWWAEQLHPFCGKSGFIIKPAKYGNKCINDSKSYYPFQGQLFTGIAASGIRDVGQVERFIRDFVIADFKGSRRNVTCDNLFKSSDLAKNLMGHNILVKF